MDYSARLKSYVDAMAQAAATINSEKPDFVLAPMLGSVPFIDAMSIVDSNFDTSKVVYMPASSRIENINNVIKDWYYNFLNEKVDLNYPLPKILGIDEVVSGQSVLRCTDCIDMAISRKRKEIKQSFMDQILSKDLGKVCSAIDTMTPLIGEVHENRISEIKNNIRSGFYEDKYVQAREDSKYLGELVKSSIAESLVYKTIGIEDSKKNGRRVQRYEALKDQKRVLPVPVYSILSMDIPDFCSPRLERLVNNETGSSGSGNIIYGPKVTDFVVTPKYLSFLKDIADYVGANSEDVHPKNMRAILESSKYLSGSNKSSSSSSSN